MILVIYDFRFNLLSDGFAIYLIDYDIGISEC